MFARTWQLVAHESQLERPGDYVAGTFAGYPVVAVRGEDGKVRAFHNVCRHRAGPLVEDGEGHCAGTFVCHYHGWRYAFDGRLASARDFGPAEGFDPRGYALFPLKCEIWRGFVFVNMDRNAAPLSESIAPLEMRMRHLSPERFRNARISTHEIRSRQDIDRFCLIAMLGIERFLRKLAGSREISGPQPLLGQVEHF